MGGKEKGSHSPSSPLLPHTICHVFAHRREHPLPLPPCTKINRAAERRAGGVTDLAGLVCSSMASTALSTELSSDWVWFAVSFSRKRVTNWSTLLPLSYTCQDRQGTR